MNDQVVILGLALLNLALLIARQWQARPKTEPATRHQPIQIDYVPESEFVEFYAQPTQLTLEL